MKLTNKITYFFLGLDRLKMQTANSDQRALSGALWSRSTLFVKDQYIRLFRTNMVKYGILKHDTQMHLFKMAVCKRIASTKNTRLHKLYINNCVKIINNHGSLNYAYKITFTTFINILCLLHYTHIYILRNTE